jgi:hypothetical protein
MRPKCQGGNKISHPKDKVTTKGNKKSSYQRTKGSTKMIKRKLITFSQTNLYIALFYYCLEVKPIYVIIPGRAHGERRDAVTTLLQYHPP